MSIEHYHGCSPDYPEKPAGEPAQQTIVISVGAREVHTCCDCGAFEWVTPSPLLLGQLVHEALDDAEAQAYFDHVEGQQRELFADACAALEAEFGTEGTDGPVYGPLEDLYAVAARRILDTRPRAPFLCVWVTYSETGAAVINIDGIDYSHPDFAALAFDLPEV